MHTQIGHQSTSFSDFPYVEYFQMFSSRHDSSINQFPLFGSKTMEKNVTGLRHLRATVVRLTCRVNISFEIFTYWTKCIVVRNMGRTSGSKLKSEWFFAGGDPSLPVLHELRWILLRINRQYNMHYDDSTAVLKILQYRQGQAARLSTSRWERTHSSRFGHLLSILQFAR